MKRISIFITLLALSIIQMTAQDTSIKGTITLLHQGNETTFAYNEMIKVMDAAVDGDTVYLSKGYFQGDFIMTKKLAFIGSGADKDKGWNNCTCYEGKIVINLPAETKLTARLFDGIYFSYNKSNITFKSAIDNVIFRKCYWDHFFFNMDTNVNYMLVDRCHCNLYTSGGYFNKLIVRNSYVFNTPEYSSFSKNMFFYNCNISYNRWQSINNGIGYVAFYGTFRNCILSSDEKYMSNPNNSDAMTCLINCLYLKIQDYVDDGCDLQNCYTYTSTDKDIFSLTKEELLSNNYLGTDGTVVGMYGGKNPYTLSLVNKEVSNKLHLDRDNKQIQFNIKVSDQQ